MQSDSSKKKRGNSHTARGIQTEKSSQTHSVKQTQSPVVTKRQREADSRREAVVISGRERQVDIEASRQRKTGRQTQTCRRDK